MRRLGLALTLTLALAASAAVTACGPGSTHASSMGTSGPAPAAKATSAKTPAAKVRAPADPPPFRATGPVAALGDSYTAGLLMPLETDTSVPGCFRSTASYAARVAKAVRARTFTSAACQSAGVTAMTTAQPTPDGVNPPQLSVLSRDDSLVMLTLSGDDMGFTHVLGKCMRLSLKDPLGAPCQDYYRGQVTQLIGRERPKMTAALSAIRARARHARILLLGYPDLFPVSGGCWPAVPITDGDIAFLRAAERRLNAMLANVAAASGATYVDTFRPTIGHDFCADEGTRDVEGLIPGTMTYSFHPNARGQAAMAAAALAALKG